MQVTVFENTTEKSLTFILEPNEQQYELPRLARIGVRHSVNDGVMGRTFADLGEHRIRFWCDSQDPEVEIVYPTSFDLLLWDMCVNLGFCGWTVNGQPTHVVDLIPKAGMITAEAFARLAISADGDDQGTAEQHQRWIDRLSAAFIKHMGALSVPAQNLTQNLAQPFD
jgi:hypothetical protein